MLRFFSSRLSLAAVPFMALTLTGARSSAVTKDAQIMVRPDSSSVDTMTSVTYVPSQGSLVTLLAEASKTAKSRSLTPVLDIGATWCDPCQTLNQLFGSDSIPLIKSKKMYVIHLDWDLWHDALASLNVDVNTGIPRVQSLNASGLPSGEPWRPRDVPEGQGWPESLQGYFANAQKLFTVSTGETVTGH